MASSSRAIPRVEKTAKPGSPEAPGSRKKRVSAAAWDEGNCPTDANAWDRSYHFPSRSSDMNQIDKTIKIELIKYLRCPGPKKPELHWVCHHVEE